VTKIYVLQLQFPERDIKKREFILDIIEGSVLLFLGELEKIIGLPIGVI
jgi:hypothetical protein